ncbi:MAG TPA: SusD/RagB family nutrient-binding outer membrane lipoprotein [Ohtaekwangia sp.]|uniref:SusD/RagB family nutrient-binding outer membrane lipoprotein n=1 Tax=Ohtaekwangia sp. TaxID=2066019 RepID=UPI002F939C61
MKRISIIIFLALAVFTIACNDYLDINENPNAPTQVDAKLVLPQALAATAISLNRHNTYGAQIGGYMANAGGYGGFNELVTYSYTSANYNDPSTGLWFTTYDNLQDYQYIINQTTGKSEYGYFNAVARIMKVFNFQLLVDTYNDVPYTDALLGANNLTPAYDDGKAVYADLASQLDSAINKINATAALEAAKTVTLVSIANADIVFAGDMTLWKQLANSIKLRLFVRGNGKVTFANTTFSADGFLAEDALINPGYSRDNNKQNPKWNTWGYTYTKTAATKSWIPTTFVIGFYNNTKLNDPGRGGAIFYDFPSTGSNQLGYENVDVPKCPTGSFWYPKNTERDETAGDTTGVLKGPEAGFPLFTAAESYFLQSEAAVRSITSGDAKALFESGITASFEYLYTAPDGTPVGDAEDDAADYLTLNNGNYLANFDLATTTERKIEAIITQKYIALNMVNSQEGWNEYRRTGYPESTGSDAYYSFASKSSQSTRTDKLPTRILYPASESAYNPANVPQGVSPFNSLIFWAK